MKKNLFSLSLISIGILAASPAMAVMNQNTPLPAGAYDGVLVKFKSGVSQKRISRAFRKSGSQQHQGFSSRLVRGLTQANVDRDSTLSETLKALRDNGDVEFAEPNYLLSTFVVPNDASFGSLWGLNNTGQTGGVADADIDAPEAWDLQTGNSVIIAVVDSGVDYNHADLAANIWSNTAEVPNNGIDDDANGFIDDVRGWDFANGDNDPMDDNDHGSHVSGTIAASGNNGAGVVGVNWSAQIMPLKTLDAAGVGNTANAIAAIDYAVANGARVINASWGGGNFSTALLAALSAANDAGVLFVAASGNDGADNDVTPSYPSDYNLPNIISVAATDDADTLAGFSNFGATSVDLGAPGVNILSTIRNNAYASFSGTSMATPHVTGVAGLVIASNPAITIAALRTTLLGSTDAVADLSGRTVTGGRLNAFNALGGTATPPTPPPPPAATTVSITPNNSTIVVGNSVQFTVAGGAAPYAWSVSNNAIGTVSTTGNFTAVTTGATAVTATDSNGIASNNANITVTAATPAITVTVTPATATVTVGSTLQFNVSGGTAPYVWSVDNATIGSINNSGLFTGLALGSVIISASENSNNVSGSSGTITVTNAVGMGAGMGGMGMGMGMGMMGGM